ncbi:hypothetical protein B0H12DRAFT_1319557, partial [Mycena haematopus]
PDHAALALSLSGGHIPPPVPPPRSAAASHRQRDILSLRPHPTANATTSRWAATSYRQYHHLAGQQHLTARAIFSSCGRIPPPAPSPCWAAAPHRQRDIYLLRPHPTASAVTLLGGSIPSPVRKPHSAAVSHRQHADLDRRWDRTVNAHLLWLSGYTARTRSRGRITPPPRSLRLAVGAHRQHVFLAVRSHRERPHLASWQNPTAALLAAGSHRPRSRLVLR